jgi:hypothetical protein
MPIGIKSTMIPSSKWDQLTREKDLIKMLDRVTINNEIVNGVQVDEVEVKIVDEDVDENNLLDAIDGDLENELITLNEHHNAERVRIENEFRDKEKENRVKNIEAQVINTRSGLIKKTREKTNLQQENNDNKMVNHSKHLLGRDVIGDSVFFFFK